MEIIEAFDFCMQDLPLVYLKGGSLIPLGAPHQHVGEANPTDDLILLVALDEQGMFLVQLLGF
jgi:hypothetical protein